VKVLGVVLHLFAASVPLTDWYSHSGLRQDTTIYKGSCNE